LISTLTGSSADDQVGNGGIQVLADGSFVVRSPSWNNPGTTGTREGAVTWFDPIIGRSGVVTASNSLVGGSNNDRVGLHAVVELANGHYVVPVPDWDNGAIANVGAVAWANGNGSTVGQISPANALVGTSASDQVGQRVLAVGNGNYVVVSRFWNRGAIALAGAITWANGSSGLVGVVSAANSMVGSSANDQVGSNGVVLLDNGNYVVSSPGWDNGATTDVGAVTWADGNSATVGAVSAANSLIGTTPSDIVGLPNINSGVGVVALRNGHYVVISGEWDNGAIASAGAVTWGDGDTGISGVVSAGNSLVGSSPVDRVGAQGVTALANGNYVVASQNWSNGATTSVGAATWGDGNGGTVGPVSPANSLIGTTASDSISSSGTIALVNGHYVVSSPAWDNGATTNVGAVTWGDGDTGLVGIITPANSLIGAATSDQVGSGALIALANGHYAVASGSWDNGAVPNVGAVTWGNGAGGTVGIVSAANSLIGTTSGDRIGHQALAALSDGDYVIGSREWDNGGIADAGAVTWADGSGSTSGVLSATNSLVGTTTADGLGGPGFSIVVALEDGHYLAVSRDWDNGGFADAGAVTLSHGDAPAAGPITAANSVRGMATNGGSILSHGYDADRQRVIIGRPLESIVSVFALPTPEIFADGFE
jgi:hypothetical protein